jgi:hypothetical protein
MYYTGYDPYTLEPVFCAHTPQDKERQRQFFFWYQKENVPRLRAALLKMGRRDLADRLFGGGYNSKDAHAPAREERASHREERSQKPSRGEERYHRGEERAQRSAHKDPRPRRK